MKNALIIVSVAVVIGGLLVSGRFAGNRAASETDVNPNSVHAGASAASRRAAPDITLAKLGGGTVSLAEFRGKPVIVDFWASWCPNCRRDMPNLNRLYEKYRGSVEVIGVNLQEKESTVRDFVDSRGISFPIALDPSGQASNAFGIQYTNTHFLLDSEGVIVNVIPGDIKEADIVALIDAAAAKGRDSGHALQN